MTCALATVPIASSSPRWTSRRSWPTSWPSRPLTMPRRCSALRRPTGALRRPAPCISLRTTAKVRVTAGARWVRRLRASSLQLVHGPGRTTGLLHGAERVVTSHNPQQAQAMAAREGQAQAMTSLTSRPRWSMKCGLPCPPRWKGCMAPPPTPACWQQHQPPSMA